MWFPFPEKNNGDNLLLEEENLITSHFAFTFVIHNFGKLRRVGSLIYSPTFNGDPKHEEQWRVQFRRRSETSIDAALQLVHSESQEEIDTKFQLCILDRQDNVLLAANLMRGTFREGRDLPSFVSFNISSLVTSEDGWTIQGAVRFYVQILTHRRIKSKPKVESTAAATAVSENLGLATEQLKSFLINENFSDVVLTSGNSRFPASKIILAAQSPVFFAMFNSKMLESESNAVVKIEDFAEETVKGFLEFLYTGQTESLEENAGELLKISEKYQVLGLKGKCEKILLTNLKIENAVDLLVLAHLHSPENLKPKIMSFVNENFKQVKNTESYERMKKEYSQIVCDLYENVMK